MNNAPLAANPSSPLDEHRPPRSVSSQRRVWGLWAAALFACTSSHAIDIGPFTLNGFAKAELTRGSNNCEDCQRFPDENRQRAWADELNVGAPFDSRTTHVTLFQPYLGVNFDLPRGFKFSGLISQRYRDGDVDIPGATYERNVAISHEDYGSVRVGAMTSRSWSVADYPFGTDIGLSDPWSSSGAGYALLGHALRYTSRIIDVAEGDLVLEATYDTGASGWEKNNPHLWEIWAQYNRGPLHLDLMFQDSRNGEPVSWGHAPFNALTPNKRDDSKLGSSGQGMIMLMGRYDVTSQLQLSAGIRRNRWSGAYAVITQPSSPGSPTGAQWNNMFNVDWDGSLNGVANPGYAVTTIDGVLGARYRFGKWVASTGMLYLGKGSTKNPSERGQSNWALFNVADLGYEFQPGLKVYAQAGMVHYGRLGLAPMSMPSTAAFTNIDPRVSKEGNWFTFGVVYAF